MANSTFKGDERTIQAGDEITGTGSGNVFKGYLSSTAGTPSYGLHSRGVQTFDIQNVTGANSFSMLNAVGVEQLWSNQSGANVGFTSVDATTTVGIRDTNFDVAVTYKDGAAASSLAFDNAGIETARAVVTLNGTNALDRIRTVDFNAVAGDSFVTLTSGAGGIAVTPTTVNITGNGAIDINDSGDELNVVTTANGSTNTGGFILDLSGNTAAVTVTGGSGDDAVIFGADQFSSTDVVNLGGGFNSLILGDSLAVTSTSALAIAINAAQNVQQLGTSATQAAISSAAFAQTSFVTIAGTNTGATGATGGSGATGTGGAAGGTGGAGANGSNAVAFTLDSGDSLSVYATTITGGAGGNGGAGGTGAGSAGVSGGSGGNAGSGAAAIRLVARVDTGTTETDLSFDAGAAVTLSGGAGGSGGAAGASGTGGALGATGANGATAVSLDASTVETLNISTVDALTDVTFTANGSTFGTSSAVSVGANATINLSGAGDINLSRQAILSVSSANNLTVNGSEMTGVLTAVTGTGNDSITGGAGADILGAGTGMNTVTGGAGRDQFQLIEGWSNSSTNMTTITDFVAGTAGDRLLTFTSGNWNAGTSAETNTLIQFTAAELQTIAAAATLDDAINAAFAVTGFDDGEVAGFTYGGITYVAFEQTTASNDSVVKLVGVNVADLVQANFA